MNILDLLEVIRQRLRKTLSKKDSEQLQLSGSLLMEIRRGDGTVECFRKDNLILNVGFDFIADSIGKDSGRPVQMGYTAIGTGTTAVVATQTALVTELTRKAAAYAHTVGTKVFTFTTTFNPGEGTGAITEAGICNSASSGIFIDRVTFAVVNKGADDTFTTTFQFTLS